MAMSKKVSAPIKVNTTEVGRRQEDAAKAGMAIAGAHRQGKVGREDDGAQVGGEDGDRRRQDGQKEVHRARCRKVRLQRAKAAVDKYLTERSSRRLKKACRGAQRGRRGLSDTQLVSVKEVLDVVIPNIEGEKGNVLGATRECENAIGSILFYEIVFPILFLYSKKNHF